MIMAQRGAIQLRRRARCEPFRSSQQLVYHCPQMRRHSPLEEDGEGDEEIQIDESESDDDDYDPGNEEESPTKARSKRKRNLDQVHIPVS